MTLDWQFVVVTIVALGAAGIVVRRFVPVRRRRSGSPARPRGPSGAACDHCAPAEPTTDRTQTTPVVSVDDLRATTRRPR
jgi:hypothetical protein